MPAKGKSNPQPSKATPFTIIRVEQLDIWATTAGVVREER